MIIKLVFLIYQFDQSMAIFEKIALFQTSELFQEIYLLNVI